MNNKIDQLGENLKRITDSLTELKDKVGLSDADKKNQAETLKKEAAEVEKQIKEEIENLKNALQNETDETLKQELNKEKEKAEALLSSISEITNLYNSIVGTQPLTSTPVQPLTEDKNIFTKAKNWVGDQWYDVRDKQKWKNETGKNILRTAGFVATGIGAVGLAYKGIKKFFKWAFSDDDEDEETEKKSKKKKKKKPFWDRWYGKALKRGAIGTGIYWVAHGIFTGSWFEDLLKRGSLKTEKPKKQVDKYKELSPEDIEKYESIGDNVNKFYDNVRSKEVSNGYNNPYDLGTISRNVAADAGNSNADAVYKGLVPFCMDDGLKNIGQLLSERNFTTYLFDKDATEVMTEITSWTTGAIGSVLGKFVGSLESFIPFSSGSGTFSEKIEAWFKSDPQSRLDELNFFFRQYTKVLTYMKDKERAIAYKITEEKCQTELSGKSENDKLEFIQNKLSDNDRFDNNVKNDSRYQKFMNSKILDSGEALSNAGLFDGEMSPILNEGIIEPLDDEFDNIMQINDEGKTIVDNGLEELKDGGIENNTKNNLIKMCNDLKDDINDNNDSGGMFSFLKGFSYLRNTDESNMETYLKESGLENVMNELSGEIDKIKTDIQNGNLDETKLQQLKETALAYFAFQKEMQLAIYTFQSIKSDDPDMLRRAIEAQKIGLNNFLGSLNRIFDNPTFKDFVIVSIGGYQIAFVMSSKVRTATGKAARNTLKRTLKQSKNAMVRIAGRPAFSNAGFEKALKGLSNITNKKSYFKHYVLNGKIRNEDLLLKIAKEELHLTNTGSMKDVLFELLSGTENSGLTKADCELLWKYAGNKNLKKLIIDEKSIGTVVDKMLADGFKPTSKQFKINTDSKGFQALREFDVEYGKLGDISQKSYFERMLKKIKSEDDIDFLNRLIKNDTFKNNIAKLKKLKLSQLRVLEESGLLDDLVTGTKNIDQILEELKTIEKMKVTKARRAFRGNIDDLVGSLSHVGNPRAVARNVKELKKLKYDINLMDEEMQVFTKFINNSANSARDMANMIIDMKKIFVLTKEITLSDGTKVAIGNRIKTLFMDGDFDEVKRLLNSQDIAPNCRTVGRRLANNFDNILKALGHSNITSAEAKSVVKNLFKVLGKVF